ncbi:MAG TPA: hypothetical protein VHG90_07135, partial [Acidimicrobiales bacterium]|nr:hypothetical protein [Acidimicrobiales bacterium]
MIGPLGDRRPWGAVPGARAERGERRGWGLAAATAAVVVLALLTGCSGEASILEPRSEAGER